MISVILGTCAVATAVTSLAPSLAMPPGLVFPADHEAGDVLQEQQRDAALAAQLDEMRALERAFRKQDAVVGDDADRHAFEMREAGDQRGAVELLELVEFAAVDDAGDDLAHIILRGQRRRDDAVELGRDRRAARRGSRRSECPAIFSLFSVPTMRRAMASAWASSLAQMVGDARNLARAHRRRRAPRPSPPRRSPPSPAAGRRGRSCPGS